jgi:RimJ/RimL family protein N-acetyltransferase
MPDGLLAAASSPSESKAWRWRSSPSASMRKWAAMQGHSLPVSIPRLGTRRLILREYREDDFDAFAAHCADPKAMAHWGVIDRRSARRAFAGNMGEWMLRGAGWWAVELRPSGALVGSVGAFFREGWPDIELGWNTFQAYWDQGIATEAAREVVRYAFEVRGERRVTALIDAPNTRSIRVAARLGMAFESDIDFYGKPCGRYALAATA